jgi:hypothetical protein
MYPMKSDPYSAEELEYRFQELRAQQARARSLFYCYAADSESDQDTEEDDIYYPYYADEHGH